MFFDIVGLDEGTCGRRRLVSGVFGLRVPVTNKSMPLRCFAAGSFMALWFGIVACPSYPLRLTNAGIGSLKFGVCG